MTGLRLRLGRSPAALVALFLVVGGGALAALAFFSITRSDAAVRKRVKESLASSTRIGGLYINAELEGLADVTFAFATRPLFIRALGGGDPGRYDRSGVRRTLNELARVRPGIGTAFVADPRGRLIDIVPPTPAIVGDDFSFRDWYRGVMRTGRPYVSEAYVSQAAGRPHVVAVAAPVRAEMPLGREGKLLAILVAAYRVDTIARFARDFARTQGVSLIVTDQRGVVVADSRRRSRELASLRHDPRVAAALRGRSGISDLAVGGVPSVSAYTPIPRLGWTFVAHVPTTTAFADVADLRRAVLLVSLLLGAAIVGAAALLARVLRQRQRAEAEVAEARDRAQEQASINRAVLDASVDAIRMVDLEGNSIVANAAMDRMASQILNLPRNGSIYERVVPLAERTTDPEGYLAATQALAEDPERESVYEYELADSGHAIQRYSAPVRNADGSVIGRIFVLRDVTAEREAERLKSELVSTVSHELRTPLASILGFAELLETREYDRETQKRHLQTINAQARRLTTLIDDFLDLQRIEQGRFRLNLEPVALHDLLREQVALFSAQSSGHTIELSLPEEELEVLGEGDRLRQVVANLLSNAIKYSPDGGRVEVAATHDRAVVSVSVTDSGVGIPADQQPQIFTKFFRVDSSSTRTIGGTGLGLALCREIVQAHGGRIGFESAEGKGSTFRFELPSTRPDRHDRGGVLVVEDDPAGAGPLAATVAREGYDVTAAASREEALALVADERPRLVCLDITMAGRADGWDGWDVLESLKANPETADVPVLVCSSDNGERRAVALGAADFLTKPFPPDRLRQTIARLTQTGDGGLVLVVDDDPGIRSLVVSTLADEGLRLREAADGQQALAAVREEPPDVIVLDLMMPELDGFAVLERLQDQEETRSIPVIVLTAKRLTPEERERMRERAVSLLEKSSYSARELRRFIRQALGEPREPER